MKILAIDYGEKRIGLATGEMFSKPFGTVENIGNLEKAADKIAQICATEEIEKIIIGLPEYDDGGEPEIVGKIKSFGNLLSNKTELDLVFEPENFTSHEAERILSEKGIDFRHDKGKVDEMAAALLLEQFLEHNK
ncbi:MAG: Holliday junction resolvase RuvX [Patescibacteria group bacterium]